MPSIATSEGMTEGRKSKSKSETRIFLITGSQHSFVSLLSYLPHKKDQSDPTKKTQHLHRSFHPQKAHSDR